jgi:hypothetical protein
MPLFFSLRQPVAAVNEAAAKSRESAAAARAIRHLVLGLRWLRCGARLFGRNPWLLGGMGFVAAASMALALRLPLAGGLLVAFLAPVWLAGAMLAIDEVSRLGMRLPKRLRKPALLQSPKRLFGALGQETLLLPVFTAALFSLMAALAIGLFAHLAGGGTWVARWTNLNAIALAAVLGIALLGLVLYVVVAAALLYALPLVCLRDEPLIPAIRASLKASARTPFAHLPLLPLVLGPFFAPVPLAAVSAAAAAVLEIVLAATSLPLAACSVYCAYRTLFPIPAPHDPARARS